MAGISEASFSKKWNAPKGKNYIEAYCIQPRDPDIKTCFVNASNDPKNDIAYGVIRSYMESGFNVYVSWNKGGDKALIYVSWPSFQDSGPNNIFLHDFKKKGKSSNIDLAASAKGKMTRDKKNLFFLVGWEGIEKLGGSCVGRALETFHSPNFYFDKDGNIRYYAFFYLMVPDAPETCKKGRDVVSGVSVVEEIIQSPDGRILKSKVYFSEDAYYQ